MDFNLLEEQTLLRDAVQRFVREQYGSRARREIVRSDAGFSADRWRSYAEFGWLGLALPADVGGLDCSFVETAIVAEEFGMPNSRRSWSRSVAA